MPDRRCACLSDDPYWCLALRYGRPCPIGPDVEVCACVCHDDWYDAVADQMDADIEAEARHRRPTSPPSS